MIINSFTNSMITSFSQRANRAAAVRTGKEDSKESKTDMVKLSSLGKANVNKKENSLVSSLKDLKSQLNKQKEEIQDRAQKTGADLSGEIQLLNEQIQELDKRIQEEQMKEIQTKITEDKNAENDSAKANKPESEEQVKARQLSGILENSMDYDRMEKLSHVKTRLEKDASLQTMFAESGPASGASSSRTEAASSLNAKASAIEASVAEGINSINNKINAKTEEHNDANKKSEAESYKDTDGLLQYDENGNASEVKNPEIW